ncbi:MAG: site-specific DNA-methyltransferase [candidate division WOR-3 bacterium]
MEDVTMENIKKFQDLLKNLFQFDASDLDFGIYRILNYKRDKINDFIEKDLENKVETAFAKHKDERLKNINQKFEETKKRVIENLGEDVFTPTGDIKENFKNMPVAREYLAIKAQKEEVEAIDEIKMQVFNDLYNFFSRYYEEGDFVPQYRYSIKGHKYAIPYNGEEVKLYWANADQYYIKTGLLFRDYTFKADEYKIILRTLEAKEELGSNKATKERFFTLDDEKPVEIADKMVILRFQYRELSEGEVKNYDVTGGSNISKQEKINQKSYDSILNEINKIELKASLSKEHKNGIPLLLYHLNRFTVKNTKDYFIHKNLKRFLSEQLDYFIKSEVLDIETLERERFLDKHITRAKVVRDIGENIIDFLSQLEDFQKRLWEKKKFVLRTEYVITTDRVPAEFYDEIWNNKEQWKEWQELGFEIPKAKEDLRNKKLPVDTKYFSQGFKERLLEKLTENNDLDDLLDGLLIKSENWQALNLLLNKYKEKVQTIYIDPPYNTGSDGFLYRDRYQHSSWLTMMENRLSLVRGLMREDGVIFVSIDDNEVDRLKSLNVFEFIANVIRITGSTRNMAINFDVRHDYINVFAKNRTKINIKEIRRVNTSNFINPDHDPEGMWDTQDLTVRQGGYEYEIPSYDFTKTFRRKWRFPLEKMKEEMGGSAIDDFSEIYKKAKETNGLVIIGRIVFKRKNGIPYYKKYLKDVLGITVNTIWNDLESQKLSQKRLDDLFGFKVFDNPKPLSLIEKIIKISSSKEDLILDFFSGSGTTAHAVLKLNKEDGSKRKFILVEMANYFDTVIIPRLKKIANSFNWKEGKPQDTDGIGGFFKYQILEQYEDTLDNIELRENQKAQELFKDDYLLKYFLDFETKESPYLLNIDRLKNPFAYKLKVNLEEVGEPKETVVDITETFNYLLGLKVKKIKTRKNGKNGRNGLTYLFILGEKDGKNVAVIWREIDDKWKDDDYKKDKEFIETEIKDWNPQIVYAPNNSVLTGNKWEIRYIEPEFKKLMEA